MQIDTGSDILWVSCDSCNDCPQSSGLGVKFFFHSCYCLLHCLSCMKKRLKLYLILITSRVLQVQLNSFSATGSSTASLISCSDAICASIVQTSSAECSTQGNQCGYSFQYGDGSGTAGYYVSDLLYFDTILGASFIANSSAPIVFG